MRTVWNKDLADEINKANASLGNVTLDDMFFQDISSQARKEFSDFGSPYANSFYVLNFSNDDVIYCRHDGVPTVAARGTPQLVGEANYAQLNGRLLFVEVRALDLSIYDDNICKMDRKSGSFRSNTDAANSYNHLHAATEEMRTPDFPYEEDMQKVMQRTIDELRCNPEDINIFKTQLLNDDERYLNVVKCYTAYIIKVDGINNDKDTYVPHLNMVLRKLPRENNQGQMSFETKVRKNSAIFHPLARIDSTRLLRSQNDALREHMYVETIRVCIWRSKTSMRIGFLVRNQEILSFPLDVTDDENLQGVYICTKDENGVVRETKYPIEEMDRFNLFLEKDEAVYRLGRDKESDTEIKRSTEARKAETNAKEEYIKEKIRETEAMKEKNNFSAKSDALKLVGALFGVIAAVTSAVVALIRLFATSRLARGLVTGVMR